MSAYIYNVSEIVSLITENKDEKNLYNKVSSMLKGAKTGTPALRAEVRKILTENHEKVMSQLLLLDNPAIAS